MTILEDGTWLEAYPLHEHQRFQKSKSQHSKFHQKLISLSFKKQRANSPNSHSLFGFLFRSWLGSLKKKVSKIIRLLTIFVSLVETFQTIHSNYPWKFQICSNFETLELFTNLFTGGNNPNSSW
jgi:hypothetical protein